MQQLRLVGVQEDGEHLLLSNEAGEEFSLPVTEALRAAATRPIGRPSAQAADAASGTLSPKEIQARIRSGASAEQVADEDRDDAPDQVQVEQLDPQGPGDDGQRRDVAAEPEGEQIPDLSMAIFGWHVADRVFFDKRCG